MNDNTILRIKVPAHLYESVKSQLTLKEAKTNYGMPESTVVKEKKSSSDKPKKTSAPKAKPVQKKAKDEKESPKDGHKKMGLEEFKALAEMLKNHIAEMDEQENESKENALEENEPEDNKKEGEE